VALLHATQASGEEGMPEGWKALNMFALLVEIAFTIFLWTQVPRWTKWRRQARALSWAWLLYFLTPFLVFLYPVASSIDYSQLGDSADAQARQAAQVAVGIGIGAQALVSLAPKIISLLQGMIRASIATKTLFPGSSAPGWLMVIAAPLYMIIFYVFVLLPYHFTDSGLVVIGMLLVLAAKGTLVRAGLRLTRPMRDEVARAATARALTFWVSLLSLGALFIIGGLWSLVSQSSALTLVSFVLSMASNILLLTLIATDSLISGLDRARGASAEERALADEVQGQLAAFIVAGSHEEAALLPPPPPPGSPPGPPGPMMGPPMPVARR
jgi:phosphoglycerol transferase MdoB-like AlkP superfamily enzyme